MKNMLVTKNAQILIENYELNESHFYHIQYKPHSITPIKLSINSKNESLIIPSQDIQGTVLKISHNQLAWTELVNETDDSFIRLNYHYRDRT